MTDQEMREKFDEATMLMEGMEDALKRGFAQGFQVICVAIIKLMAVILHLMRQVEELKRKQ